MLDHTRRDALSMLLLSQPLPHPDNSEFWSMGLTNHWIYLSVTE